jgi:hypothetical protein
MAQSIESSGWGVDGTWKCLAVGHLQGNGPQRAVHGFLQGDKNVALDVAAAMRAWCMPSRVGFAALHA